MKPASPMSDDGILDHLRKAYYQEPAFQQFAIEEREKGRAEARARRTAWRDAARSTSRLSMASSP